MIAIWCRFCRNAIRYKKKTCPLFSQTKDRLKAFSKIWSQ
nr:MAG TPA: hypothetical protein [Caudoviricetes sp.]